MKKILRVVLFVVLFATMAVTLAACKTTPREEVLKIYLPGNYIDEDYMKEAFPAWYKEQTGKNVELEFITFEAVENIQTNVETGKADYDILCPSDYMVEYLLSKDLLQKVDKNVIDISEEGLFRTEYVNTTKEFDPTLEYAVPYMYGTLGLVYDYSKTNEHITSWEALFGDKYAGKRSVKKSIHDAYAAACLYAERNNLIPLTSEQKKAAVQAVFENTTDEMIAKAKNVLNSVKSSAVWDVDTIKFQMATNQSDVAVALMWSCDAGYVMNDYEDDDGNEFEGNRNLWYVVPEEGGNVYIDAFVISKYAVNVNAANWFLKFVSQKDVAIVNSEWAGAISPVAAAYDDLLTYYTEDEDGMFENVSEEWKAMFIETMFPSAETLNRCGVMKDFGARKSAVNTMWGNIVA